jgi:hypothetical protein
VKKYKENTKIQLVQEDLHPIKTFSSQEEAERYNMIQNIERGDMEKFHLFCSMLSLQKLYRNAKVYNYKDSK